jgi:NADPH:quinone reductase-like Zn-dependent oxidoreductase
MQVAGIRRVGDQVELIDVGEPRPLADDEVLVEVEAAGVANWDEFVRTGGWDVGARPPMALGVEAAGAVLAAGRAAGDWAPGDAVMTHPVPLRDQGTWAPRLIAPAGLLARKPDRASWEAAAAFPVPALTAGQVLRALSVRTGEPLLVHGASGVTGRLLVALAALRGAAVIATAGPASRHLTSWARLAPGIKEVAGATYAPGSGWRHAGMSSAKNSPISVPSERVTTTRVICLWPIRCASAAASSLGRTVDTPDRITVPTAASPEAAASLSR